MRGFISRGKIAYNFYQFHPLFCSFRKHARILLRRLLHLRLNRQYIVAKDSQAILNSTLLCRAGGLCIGYRKLKKNC